MAITVSKSIASYEERILFYERVLEAGGVTVPNESAWESSGRTADPKQYALGLVKEARKMLDQGRYEIFEHLLGEVSGIMFMINLHAPSALLRYNRSSVDVPCE